MTHTKDMLDLAAIPEGAILVNSSTGLGEAVASVYEKRDGKLYELDARGFESVDQEAVTEVEWHRHDDWTMVYSLGGRVLTARVPPIKQVPTDPPMTHSELVAVLFGKGAP